MSTALNPRNVRLSIVRSTAMTIDAQILYSWVLLLSVLDGEKVIRATPDIGYLHTGMEKLFEYKKYQQGIVITDRWIT